jgi:hypothetical protein
MTANQMGITLGALARAVDLPRAPRPSWIRWLPLDQLRAIQTATGVPTKVVEGMKHPGFYAHLVLCERGLLPDLVERSYPVAALRSVRAVGIVPGLPDLGAESTAVGHL